MYSKIELQMAAKRISYLASRDNIPEPVLREMLREAMDTGLRSKDPAVQARWKGFAYRGEEPTVEEFILWCAQLVREET